LSPLSGEQAIKNQFRSGDFAKLKQKTANQIMNNGYNIKHFLKIAHYGCILGREKNVKKISSQTLRKMTF